MFDTSCSPANVVAVLWIICILLGTAVALLWTTKNMFPIVFFLFILQTVSLWGFYKLTTFFCKKGHHVLSWFMILSPVVVYPLLFALFGVLATFWFNYFGGPTLVEERHER
jgi:hypothetical protein